MKIINNKVCKEIIQRLVCQHPECVKLPLYEVWKKINKFLLTITPVCSFVLGLLTFKKMNFDFNMLMKALVLFAVMVVVHELIHMLSYKKDCYIVIDSSAISIFCARWVRKNETLLALVLPVILLEILIIIYLIISLNIIVFVWLSWLNFVLASSDIVSFYVILKKAPSDSLIMGHYYRCQQ